MLITMAAVDKLAKAIKIGMISSLVLVVDTFGGGVCVVEDCSYLFIKLLILIFSGKLDEAISAIFLAPSSVKYALYGGLTTILVLFSLTSSITFESSSLEKSPISRAIAQ